jgi:glutathione S-transferase
MQTSPLTIWGISTSRTLRVHWLAHELGISYNTEPVRARTGETQTAKYLTLSPKGKVPMLTHGSLVVTESAAILGYLSEQFGANTEFFVPTNAAERARLNDWCYSIMTEMDAHPLYIIRRHEALADIYGSIPQAVTSAREYFARMAAAIALRMDENQPYIFGQRLSIADILLTTTLTWARSYDLALPQIFSDYLARASARTAYLSAYAHNYPDAAPSSNN